MQRAKTIFIEFLLISLLCVVQGEKCYLRELIDRKRHIYSDACKAAIYTDEEVDILPQLEICNLEVQFLRLQEVFADGYNSFNQTSLMPDVLGIGVQKGGTSALQFYLWHHKQVYAHRELKELHYFDQCNTLPIEAYQKWFKGMSKKQTHKIDITPEYVFYPDAPCLMSVLAPHAKLILILRDPIERYLSAFRYEKQRQPLERFSQDAQFLSISFNDLVNATISTMTNTCQFQTQGQGQDIGGMELADWYECFGCKSPLRGRTQKWYFRKTEQQEDKYAQFLGRGMYLVQIKWLLQFFDKSQLYIIDSSKMKKNTMGTINDTLKFIGLDNSIEKKVFQKKIHRTSKKGEFSNEVLYQDGLVKLHEFYHPQIVALKKYLVEEFGEEFESVGKWPTYNDSFNLEDYF
eukprot:TRINITY_DN3062_c0_g1_i1.p2 TRINITY_DN3062_c0_g1~~TRINITY_DN3062_c0_g1_i1.p2  ORF type:complete len:405 (+),score=29.47 TRINITY_DN3062_c0_g1_i1:39-1253(+)